MYPCDFARMRQHAVLHVNNILSSIPMELLHGLNIVSELIQMLYLDVLKVGQLDTETTTVNPFEPWLSSCRLRFYGDLHKMTWSLQGYRGQIEHGSLPGLFLA